VVAVPSAKFLNAFVEVLSVLSIVCGVRRWIQPSLSSLSIEFRKSTEDKARQIDSLTGLSRCLTSPGRPHEVNKSCSPTSHSSPPSDCLTTRCWLRIEHTGRREDERNSLFISRNESGRDERACITHNTSRNFLSQMQRNLRISYGGVESPSGASQISINQLHGLLVISWIISRSRLTEFMEHLIAKASRQSTAKRISSSFIRARPWVRSPPPLFPAV
jgi:hypothetical protein